MIVQVPLLMTATEPKLALVVDDATEMRHLAARVVGSFGYEVIEASGGNPAFEILLFRSIDFLVTDLDMCNGDGYDLVLRARKLRPDLPILVISSQSPATLAHRDCPNDIAFVPKGACFAENLARAVGDAPIRF